MALHERHGPGGRFVRTMARTMARQGGPRPGARPPVPRAQRGRVSAKISRLRGERVPQQQAVATALSMARAGRLGPRGGYRRAGR